MEDIVKNKNLILFGVEILPGETYTTNPERIIYNSSLTISAQANANFNIDLQFSHFRYDTDFRSIYTADVLADEPFFKVSHIAGEFARVVITNTDTINCKIVLYSYCSQAKQITHTHGLDKQINPKEHGELSIVANDYLTSLIQELYVNRKSLIIQGIAHNFTNKNTRTIYNNDSIYYSVSGGILKIQSTSINDTSAGSGARTILITGLDSNYNEIVENIVLNGLTTVVSVNQFLRVNNARVITTGNLGYNAGDITIRDNTTNNVIEVIHPEYNETKSFKYCVPANKRLIIKNLNVSGTLDDLTNIKIFYKPYNQPAILITDLDVNTSSFFTITKPINIKLTSKTDVYGTVKLSHSPSGGKIDSISAQIECELYTEQDIPNIIIS
jgi:hypothetical protein